MRPQQTQAIGPVCYTALTIGIQLHVRPGHQTKCSIKIGECTSYKLVGYRLVGVIALAMRYA